MGAGRALPDLAARDRRAAYPLVARGVQRPALRGAPRHPVAGDAPRPAAVARRVRPGDAVAEGGLLRDAGARPARGAAPGGGARGGPGLEEEPAGRKAGPGLAHLARFEVEVA